MDDPAMNSENMENTQTRKTVKVKVPTTPVSEKLASAMGDTHTRKTVKLKPLGQSASNTNSRPVQQVIASPLQSRDTDTGNLSVMSDTQTRKTVKLKPLAPGAHHPVQVPAPAPAAAPMAVPPPAAAEKKAEDDITRKVSTIKPAAKPGITLPGVTPKPVSPSAPTVPMMPSPAAAEKKAEDDITRKVSTIKPAAKPGITLPPGGSSVSPSKQTMVLPENEAPAAAGEVADTIKLQTAAAPAVAASKQTMVLPDDDENSATVKIARPASRMGMIPPKPSLTPKPVAPSALTVAAAPAVADAAAEKKLPSLAKKETAAAPAVADDVAEKKLPSLAKKETADESADEAPKKLGLKKKSDDAGVAAGGPPMLDDVVVTREEADGDTPSVFYTVITAVAVVLLLASVALSAVNYFNLYEGQNIQLPGLSSVK